jgi:hypothetical protein
MLQGCAVNDGHDHGQAVIGCRDAATLDRIIAVGEH